MSIFRRRPVVWTGVLVFGLCVAAAARPATAQKAPAKALFAGGCFWCMEPAFEKVDGVSSVTSGYTGGQTKNPTYEQVSAGVTGHAESIQVVYDPSKVTYEKLLGVFWHNIDPLAGDAQFCDHGTQYRAAIFYLDETQKRLAEESKRAIEESKRFGTKTIRTQIVAAGAFYPAEDYHQDFYKKSPARYYSYRAGCGRDQRLKELWGSDAGHGGGER